MAISTVSDPSGSGRVDMLTGPVAAARAAAATGAWVKSKHDMYLIRGSVGAQALFLPIRQRIKTKQKKTSESKVLKFRPVKFSDNLSLQKKKKSCCVAKKTGLPAY